MPPIEDDISILIKGCKENDRKAQERLYTLFYEAMTLLCLRYTKNVQDALEVLNNGFLKVFKKIDQYDPARAALSTWIRTIMVNSAIDFIRTQKPSYTSLTDHEEEAAAVENEAVSKMDAEELLTLIRNLPTTTKLVFNLYIMEGYSHGEIASMLGVNEGTSRWHLSEARKILKRHIKPQQLEI